MGAVKSTSASGEFAGGGKVGRRFHRNQLWVPRTPVAVETGRGGIRPQGLGCSGLGHNHAHGHGHAQGHVLPERGRIGVRGWWWQRRGPFGGRASALERRSGTAVLPSTTSGLPPVTPGAWPLLESLLPLAAVGSSCLDATLGQRPPFWAHCQGRRLRARPGQWSWGGRHKSRFNSALSPRSAPPTRAANFSVA